MKSKYLFFLCVPVLVYARITIKITAGTTESAASVHYTGSDVAIISDLERISFQLTDKRLKEACGTFVGTKPTDVYVKSPKPLEDLYYKFDWQQVQRILRPIRARIMGVHTNPITILTRELENNSQVKVKVNAGIYNLVKETVSNSWSKCGELTIGQEIKYKVNFASGSVGENSSLSFAMNWGNETCKANAFMLGSTSSVDVELCPGQAVVATLGATRGTLDIEIDYEAYLTGAVLANYQYKWRNHNWWSFPIEYVMIAADMTQFVHATERLSVDFYTSASVIVSDRKTNRTMTYAPAGIIGTTKHVHQPPKK